MISGLGTGTMTIGAKGTLDVEKGTSGPGATLDGVKVTDKNTSTGTAAGITVGTGASAATLLVDDGTVISGLGTGTMTIGAKGTLDVEQRYRQRPRCDARRRQAHGQEHQHGNARHHGRHRSQRGDAAG